MLLLRGSTAFLQKILQSNSSKLLDDLQFSFETFGKNYGVKKAARIVGLYYWKKLFLHKKRFDKSLYRSCHQRSSAKKVFLKIFQISQETAVLEYLFNIITLQACTRATLLKRVPNTSVFLRNFAKFLRTHILKNICEQLLLSVKSHCSIQKKTLLDRQN